MTRDGLLKSIAETGYNVGFGAKKNFATHDIVQKVPGALGLVSLLVGLYALIWEALNAKWIAATMVAFGIVTLIITHYDTTKVLTAMRGSGSLPSSIGSATSIATCKPRRKAMIFPLIEDA